MYKVKFFADMELYKDTEEAKEKIMNYEYEDIFDEYDTEIVEVLDIKEE